MRTKTLIILVTLVTVLAFGQTQVEGTIDLTHGGVGHWLVFDAVDYGGTSWNDSTLFFTTQILNQAVYDLTGYCIWYANGSYWGTEYFTGTYDPLNMTVHLDTDYIIDNGGTYVYDAEVHPDGYLIYDGTWGTGVGVIDGPWSAEYIPEAATPPVADADGPYTIYVGDTLTLDANGSTADDNDIVSYMWDLDDNNSFETDAGSQAILDVNYTYLQSLGLLVDHTYNIHLQVTDGDGQSDTNDTTLTILPKPALKVAVDIKPGSCPNPLNVKSSGVLPVAVLGSAEFDVNAIVPTSVRLAGVYAVRDDYEDVAAPVQDANDCNCTTDGPDGFLDLTLKFKIQEIVEAIGEVNDADVLSLTLTGVLSGEKPIEGTDCISVRGRFKPFNKADFNRDGVVDMADFAALAEDWLQSSIVED
ncbi:MAG: PKD domain-containing protein [Planctomycetota bacterium]|jgi:hypothetical protein